MQVTCVVLFVLLFNSTFVFFLWYTFPLTYLIGYGSLSSVHQVRAISSLVGDGPNQGFEMVRFYQTGKTSTSLLKPLSTSKPQHPII